MPEQFYTQLAAGSSPADSTSFTEKDGKGLHLVTVLPYLEWREKWQKEDKDIQVHFFLLVFGLLCMYRYGQTYMAVIYCLRKVTVSEN